MHTTRKHQSPMDTKTKILLSLSPKYFLWFVCWKRVGESTGSLGEGSSNMILVFKLNNVCMCPHLLFYEHQTPLLQLSSTSFDNTVKQPCKLFINWGLLKFVHVIRSIAPQEPLTQYQRIWYQYNSSLFLVCRIKRNRMDKINQFRLQFSSK